MRTLSRLSALGLATALALSLTACAKDAPAPKVEPSPSPSSSATPTETPEPSASPVGNPTKKPSGGAGVICRDKSGMAPFTGPAAVKFGAENVMDAYCEMGDFFYLNAVTGLTAPNDSFKPVELSFAKPFLSPDMQDDWDKSVQEAVDGKESGILNINGLTYFNLTSVKDPYSFPAPGEGPMMVGGGVSPAQTKVVPMDDGRELLSMNFSVYTNIVVKKNGTADYVFPVTRDVALFLLPSDGTDEAHDWIIYDWATDWHSKDAKPLKDVVGG